MIGGVSVLATFLIVGGLTEITGISQIVEFLIALSGSAWRSTTRCSS